MLGDGQGQQLEVGKERGQHSLPKALFKYMVRGGQIQESEQTEVRTCNVCSRRAEFAGDLKGLVLLSDGRKKKRK